MTEARETAWAKLLGVLDAARINKNASSILLVVCGGLVVGTPSAAALAIGSASVLLIAAFATQLNVITDRVIDAQRKPRFFRALARSWRLTLWVMSIELLLALAGIGCLLAMRRPLVAAMLLVVLLFAVLYAYNFLRPRAAEARRWKVVWWRHALAFVGGYTALWSSGAFAVPGRSVAELAPFLPGFVAAAVSEYAFYLTEAAGDADEERTAGLRTLPALIGQRGTTWVALVASLAACGALLAVTHGRAQVAVGAGSLLRLGCVLPFFAAAHRDGALFVRLTAYLPDYVFHLGRLVTLGLLIARLP